MIDLGAGRNLTFQGVADNEGRYPAINESSSPAPEVVVSGSGFGPAPNVVLLRTFKEGSDGNQLQAEPPEGEVGTLSGVDSGDQYVEWNGETVWQGFKDGGVSKIQFIAPREFKRFRHYCSLAVPEGSSIPCGTDPGAETFCGASDWKPVWFMLSDNGNQGETTSNEGDADIALPTVIGGGTFTAAGNSVTWDSFRFIENGNGWDWNRFVGFGAVGDSDLDNPKTVAPPGPLETHNTSTAGTNIRKKTDRPAFAGSDSNVTDSNAAYDRIKYQPYANGSDGNAQAYFRDLYLAIESSPDAGDWKQALLLGDAAAYEDCTVLRPKLHNSWSDGEVRFNPDYGLSFYHIIKPDGTVVSGEAV